jgi:uncharacterized protein (DUF433 family)
MRLKEYFNFVTPQDIRIKGTRVGIETVLYDFLYRSRSPEEIVASYPSLTLEQVYATITYYLHNQETVTDYLTTWLETAQQRWEAQNQHPPPAVHKLRRAATKSKSVEIQPA